MVSAPRATSSESEGPDSGTAKSRGEVLGLATVMSSPARLSEEFGGHADLTLHKAYVLRIGVAVILKP